MPRNKVKRSYPDDFGTINLKIDRNTKAKYSALLTLENKDMQSRIIELIEKDVDQKMARQPKTE